MLLHYKDMITQTYWLTAKLNFQCWCGGHSYDQLEALLQHRRSLSVARPFVAVIALMPTSIPAHTLAVLWHVGLSDMEQPPCQPASFISVYQDICNSSTASISEDFNWH